MHYQTVFLPRVANSKKVVFGATQGMQDIDDITEIKSYSNDEYSYKKESDDAVIGSGMRKLRIQPFPYPMKASASRPNGKLDKSFINNLVGNLTTGSGFRY